MHDAVPTLSQTPRCVDCPIRHRTVCSLCEPEELGVLERIKTYRRYGAGEAIFWAGDDMPFVGTIVDGHATISKTMEDGRRQTLGLLLSSDFIRRPDRTVAPVRRHGKLGGDALLLPAVGVETHRRRDAAHQPSAAGNVARRA